MTTTLFSPLQLGDLQLPNRIIMSPLTRTRAEPGHVPGALMATHYAQRATAGLIIAEATLVAPGSSAYMNEPGIYSEAQVAGWKRVVDAVHHAGGRIALQAFHPGRASHAAMNDGVQPVSSTDRAIRASDEERAAGKGYDTPRRLTTAEVGQVITQFRHAFENARRAGFDAVEVHGAHGYLLDQFLRDSVNDRDDEYGGSIEKRARLLLAVLDEAIAVFGSGRVGLRISPLVAFNDISDSNPPALLQYLAQEIERRAVAFLDFRHDRHDAPAEEALYDILRLHYRGLVLRNGGYDRDSGSAELARGRADAIIYGKAFIANPDLVERLRKNAPLAQADFSLLYTPGPRGYIDYPALEPTSLDEPALA
ncbi:alkene reductase [Solimonas soli]|uniref:alkene reductase n=1 Tax=Solimonas soli TaxID=413479 RepID=UPI000482F51B|nr:alkene reductase [Solimonas soli]